jgi:hypothetical protein
MGCLIHSRFHRSSGMFSAFTEYVLVRIIEVTHAPEIDCFMRFAVFCGPMHRTGITG